MRFIKSIHFLIALLLGTTYAQANITNEQLVLRTPEGLYKTIADYQNKGKWSVVVFWASDCSVCNEETQQYSKLHNRRKDTDLEVLGISLDGWNNVNDAKSFINRNKVTFPNLVGANAAISDYFAQLSGKYLQGTPAIFIYNRTGELVAAEVGAVPVSIIENYVAQNDI